jgi:malonyl-CoA O-methyltransferase
MTIQNAYNQWSSTYDHDRNLTRDLDEHIIRQVLANRPGRLTLEIGCGTGKNTTFLSQVSEQVLAVDFSEGMLQLAKEKIEAPNVRFCLADLTHRWPLHSASVDRIVCDLVLEHIQDLSHVFSEAAHCLRKGGYFFISELHPFRQYQGTKAIFEQEADRVEVQAFVHNISDFFSAGLSNGLVLEHLQEWRHSEDQDRPPRIISFVFTKPRHA